MNQEVRETIREMLAEMLEEEPQDVGDEAHLVKELGADSMSVLELMASLEQRFDIVIRPEFFPELVTLNQSAALVERLLHENG